MTQNHSCTAETQQAAQRVKEGVLYLRAIRTMLENNREDATTVAATNHVLVVEGILDRVAGIESKLDDLRANLTGVSVDHRTDRERRELHNRIVASLNPL